MIINKIQQNGYTNCVAIFNDTTHVVIEPDCGGRILSYSLKGVDIIYQDPDEDGYLLSSGKQPKSNLSPCAGRCDIGPEMTTPPHPELWLGKWEVEIISDNKVKLISPNDKVTGVRLEREVELANKSSELKFTQTIINISKETQSYFHWSRTFCKGGGIAIAPINAKSRFPKGYITYGPGDRINYLPESDENVVCNDGMLQIIGTPRTAKFAMDLSEGWLAYLSKDNRLLIKTFEIYPDRIYGEIAANNMSFWYNEDIMCEVEPIGPVEKLQPGESASFTEKWQLFEFYYRAEAAVDTSEIRKLI